jgi:hypothetical protein
MTITAARKFIILTSLTASGLIFIFFLVAKPLGYPLDWDESQRIIEILLPVFVGYLGTATHFLFHNPQKQHTFQLGNAVPLLGILIKGPVVIFAISCFAILFAFGYSNRHGAPQDSGMSVDQLAWAFTAALGILTVSSSVAVSYLFSLEGDAGNKSNRANSDTSNTIAGDAES